MNLRAANVIDPQVEGHYAFYSFANQLSTQAHYHDFYEVFLIHKGSVYHHVNGEVHLLNSGALVLIRPQDTHHYAPDADHPCELINLAFLRSTFADLSAYLDLTARQNILLEPQLPPQLSLSAQEKATLSTQLQELGRLIYSDKARARLIVRTGLAHIMGLFVMAVDEDSAPADAPAWLLDLCKQMQRRENIVEGRAALLRLAQRSEEHVGRSFKAHLGLTPSQYINNLRLEYASELLLHSDQPVSEVCFAVGFENLSHFHHLFKDRWGYSPNEFRRLQRRTVIP